MIVIFAALTPWKIHLVNMNILKQLDLSNNQTGSKLNITIRLIKENV